MLRPAVWFAAILVASPLAAQTFTVDDMFDVRTASVADLSDDGRLALVTTRTLRDRIGIDNHRYGDPTYRSPGGGEVLLIDTRTGERTSVYDGSQVLSAAFSPDGGRLALLVAAGDALELVVRDLSSGRMRTLAAPRENELSDDSSLEWLDGGRLAIALRPAGWRAAAKARFDQEVNGPVVVRSSEDPFLSWEEIRRIGYRRLPAIVDVASGRFAVLGDEILGGFSVTEGGEWLRTEPDITKATDYDAIFGRESALTVRRLDGGEERELFKTTKGMRFLWSGDGTRYVYGKEGSIFAGTLADDEARKIVGPEKRDTAATPEEEPDSAARAAEREQRRKERFTPVRLSHDGTTVIATNSEGYWLIDVASGDKEMFLEAPTGGDDDEDADDERPRWAIVGWSEDGTAIYLSEQSRTEWQRALHRYDRATKRRTELARGQTQDSGFDLSADGSTMVFTRTETNRPGQLWVAGENLSSPRLLFDPNPQLAARTFGDARLIDYLDADGEKQYGVLYLPADYREGTRLPTIFLVYEDFFDARFNATTALLNANGYAVIQPSVSLEQGFPGEAWMKGVTAAANKLIEMGVADPERMGVHGTSYGGYATNLLITQTHRFKAAINISGKVDMISFYTDSPRLATRNIHAPEKSQDRIGATLWEQPQKYIAHSAIMFADRIDTPLLLMTGQQDHNVPERTTSEMFYALRRLGKRVEWVSYINGGHGMPTTTEAEVRDYHERILGWYGRYLKSADAVSATEVSSR